jgi:hypothetical protein
MTCKDISKIINRHPGTISKNFNKLGLEMKTQRIDYSKVK